MQSVETVIIPAAGMGNRLGSLTANRPKCLVEVNNEPMLGKILQSLEETGFRRVIIVTGFKAEMIEAFLSSYPGRISIETVCNKVYDETNNIYSIFLSFPLLRSDEPFVILESDLVFEENSISEFRKPDMIALAPFDPEIHDGTTAAINKDGFVMELFTGKTDVEVKDLYKTVNITSFGSSNGSLFKKYITEYVKQGDLNAYYEIAIEAMILKNKAQFKAVNFENIKWGEIDTREDHNRVSNQFDSQRLIQ
jgi:choline kinase